MESWGELEEMETFWIFWHQFSCVYDSFYDFDFLFSQGDKRSYDSDSDSVASENQPLVAWGVI